MDIFANNVYRVSFYYEKTEFFDSNIKLNEKNLKLSLESLFNNISYEAGKLNIKYVFIFSIYKALAHNSTNNILTKMLNEICNKQYVGVSFFHVIYVDESPDIYHPEVKKIKLKDKLILNELLKNSYNDFIVFNKINKENYYKEGFLNTIKTKELLEDISIEHFVLSNSNFETKIYCSTHCKVIHYVSMNNDNTIKHIDFSKNRISELSKLYRYEAPKEELLNSPSNTWSSYWNI